MKIYIDLVLLLNFGFDLILLFSVAIILRRQTNLKRLIVASLIGSITILSMFIKVNSLELFLIKIVISILMVLITFKYKNIKYTLANLFYLYTSSIILGGFLYFLNIQFSYKNEGLVFYFNGLSINIIILIIMSPIIIYLYTKQVINIKTNYNNYHYIEIFLKNGDNIRLTTYLDTGNKLEDPYKRRPIILINPSLLKDSYLNHSPLIVPYDALNYHGLLKCIIPEKVYIEGVGYKNNILIGLSKETIKIDGIDGIIGPNLLER